MTNATQIIILGVFIFFLVVAVIVFAAFGGTGSGAGNQPVIIWGTLPSDILPKIAEQLNTGSSNPVKIQYVEIPAEKFEDTLTNALADGTGPDAVIMPENLLYQNRKRLAIISYNTYPERTFKDTFASASEVLLTADGTYGLPFLIDPLVMYWNRDILDSAAVALPPSTWEDTLALVPKITQVNIDKTIKQSAIGLGDYTNVDNGEGILSALMMQAGGQMVVWDTTSATNPDTTAKNLISISSNTDTNPVEAALGFFTEFADPEKPVYSWTGALPQSIDYFTQGDLALYFGPSSDEAKIRAENPNLNFDVAILPQPGSATDKKTSATVWSFSILASSKNQTGALTAIEALTSSAGDKIASDELGLPPARRDLLATLPGVADQSTFYQSALIAESWLDPDPTQTSPIFGTAVESIVSGQTTVADSAKTLSKSIDEILNDQQ